jgi:recombination protein RecA
VTEQERQRAIRIRLCRTADAPAHLLPPLSTGNPAVDAALGGGLPRGAIVEIFGAESSGKTMLALRAIAALQRSGGGAALIDADRTFDAARAATLGVSLDSLVLARPGWSEQALEMVRALVLSRALELVVIDSAAALVPRAELDSSLEAAGAGWHSAVLARALRRLRPAAARCGVCLLFLNQLRSGSRRGPEISAGGRALRSYAALRVELRRRKSDGMVRLRVVRNKFGATGGAAELGCG